MTDTINDDALTVDDEAPTTADDTPTTGDGDGASDTAGQPGRDPWEVSSPQFRRAANAQRRAGARLTAARKAQADAEGAVRVATLKLAEYEGDDDKTESQVAAVEEAIARAERAAEKAAAQVADAERELDDAADLVDFIRQQLRAAAEAEAATAAAAGGEEAADEAPRELMYGSVVMWFREWFRHRYKRIIRGGDENNWNASWWSHLEAEEVMTALWRAWEHFRWDETTGMSIWWRDHARPHLGSLMAKSSTPFKIADVRLTEYGEPLPHTEPPAGLFLDVRGPDAVMREIVSLLSDHQVPDWAARLGNYLVPADRQGVLALLSEVGELQPDGDTTVTVLDPHTVEGEVPTLQGPAIVTLEYQAAGYWALTGYRQPEPATMTEGEPG